MIIFCNILPEYRDLPILVAGGVGPIIITSSMSLGRIKRIRLILCQRLLCLVKNPLDDFGMNLK